MYRKDRGEAQGDISAFTKVPSLAKNLIKVQMHKVEESG